MKTKSITHRNLKENKCLSKIIVTFAEMEKEELIMKKDIFFALLAILLLSCNQAVNKEQSTKVTSMNTAQMKTESVFYDTIRITDDVLYVVVHERIGNKVTKGEIVKYIDNDGNEISQDDPRCNATHKKGEYGYIVKAGDTIFYEAETLPMYPGGKSEMEAYLKRNTVYPYDEINNHPTGKVGIQCQIKKDGTIGIVSVCRSIDPKLDAEAIRIVSSFPSFTPATIQGKNVSCWYIVMVPFQ